MKGLFINTHLTGTEREQLTEYFEGFARRSGFRSATDYFELLAKRKGFCSLEELQADIVRQWRVHPPSCSQIACWEDGAWLGLASRLRPSYRLSKTIRKRNRRLSQLITTRLKESGRTQSWLAKQLGVSREAVRQYVMGISYPQKRLRARLEGILNISLEERPSDGWNPGGASTLREPIPVFAIALAESDCRRAKRRARPWYKSTCIGV